MSSLDVERRLTEVLHRHAEDAMSQTDSQQELQEFLARGHHEPPRAPARPRTLAVLGGGLAAAAVAAAVVWSSGLSEDRTDRAPVQEPVPPAVQVAEEFVAAYAVNDTETVASLAAPDADLRGWHMYMARDAAWSVQFLFEPCQAITEIPDGTGVACLFAVHGMQSQEVGRGPFEDASFTVWVDEDGKVFDAEPTWNHENNGLAEHVEAVTGWIFETYPEDRKFLSLEESNVPPAQFDRWLGLWERYIQEYADAHS